MIKDHNKFIVISKVPTETQEPKLKLINDHKKYLTKIIKTIIRDKKTLGLQSQDNLLPRCLPKKNKVIKAIKET